MKRSTMSIIAAPAVIAGALAAAGPASASTAGHEPSPQPVTTSQFGQQRDFGQQFDRFPRPEPVRVVPRPVQIRFFCTRGERREEIRLLFSRHLDRQQRAELRFLEDICGFPFLGGGPIR